MLLYWHNDDGRLWDFFTGQSGQAGTRIQSIFDFIGAKDDGGGGDKMELAIGLVLFRNGTAERNDCVSFRILQEYDYLRNGMAERTVISRNGTLILTLCLTLP